MSADTGIRIALVAVLLLFIALIVFGATRAVVVAPTAQEDASKKDTSKKDTSKEDTAPTRSQSVEEACDEARVKLLTGKEEEFEPFERFHLEQAIEKLCD
jgi:flagellar biosynthesis/type III secretory pathway M-ring protein FliF/YscJ